jgi:hypothetical protein
VALNRYVVTADTTVPAGTAAIVTAGEPGTGGAAGFGSAAVASGPLRNITYRAGTPLLLDTAGSLYAALNVAGALRAFTDADAAGRPGISN